jgi:hypothetical protein
MDKHPGYSLGKVNFPSAIPAVARRGLTKIWVMLIAGLSLIFSLALAAIEKLKVLAHNRASQPKHYQAPLISPRLGRDQDPNLVMLAQQLNTLRSVRIGKEGSAADYERTIETLLAILFHPFLTDPERQVHLHDGRKVVDLVYTNSAPSGFFKYLSRHVEAPFIFVECKNYRGDAGTLS